MPFEHKLIVKLHPHDYLNDNKLIDEINLHYNVKILLKEITLHDIMPYINLVFLNQQHRQSKL